MAAPALLFPLTEKRCPSCKITHPLATGFRRGSKKGGVAIYCRGCEDAYQKQRRAAAKDIAVTRVESHGKACIRCLKVKPASSYLPSNHTLDGYAQRCTQCRGDLAVALKDRRRAVKRDTERMRAAKLRREYGLTEQAFLEMRVDQHDACAICREPFDARKAICVDHCHDSGNVRGLLCHQCNTAIGFLKDNPTVCRMAAEYLEQAKGGHHG